MSEKTELEGRKLQRAKSKPLISSGAGSRFKNANLDDFSAAVRSRVETNLIDGMGLYIIGPVGVGKTHLAYSVRNRFGGVIYQTSDVLARIRATYGAVSAGPRTKYFTNRDGYQQYDGMEYPETEEEVVLEFVRERLLVLDDLGIQRETDWTVETLNRIIDKRYADMKLTIITSNLSLKELAEKYDYRLASRIAEMCTVLKLEGKDRRLDSSSKV